METDLYPPVKRHLERLGYAVKGEIGGCDIVALHEGEDGTAPLRVVIGELKTSFTLELVLQAVDRGAAADEVWLAVAASKRGRGREADGRVKKLCRRLGFGLMSVTVTASGEGRVDVLVEPDAAPPRRDSRRRSRLVEEHRRRRGDPVAGGTTRRPQLTAYRQEALALAVALAEGPGRPRDLKAAVPSAAKILQGNVYGWFERVERGVYGLTDAGRAALTTWAEAIAAAAEAA